VILANAGRAWPLAGDAPREDPLPVFLLPARASRPAAPSARARGQLAAVIRK